jgi:hypothetical protein
MKTMKALFAVLFLGTIATMQAQDASVKNETRINTNADKIAYYQQRGAADAKFEIAFEAKSKAEEKDFWKEQKAYEKELKKKNRTAYHAYFAGKQDAYREHHYHCDAHCHHNDSFYSQAGFYYDDYDQHNYQRTPSSTTVNTQIGVRTPSVRLGVF